MLFNYGKVRACFVRGSRRGLQWPSSVYCRQEALTYVVVDSAAMARRVK